MCFPVVLLHVVGNLTLGFPACWRVESEFGMDSHCNMMELGLVADLSCEKGVGSCLLYLGWCVGSQSGGYKGVSPLVEREDIVVFVGLVGPTMSS